MCFSKKNLFWAMSLNNLDFRHISLDIMQLSFILLIFVKLISFDNIILNLIKEFVLGVTNFLYGLRGSLKEVLK